MDVTHLKLLCKRKCKAIPLLELKESSQLGREKNRSVMSRRSRNWNVAKLKYWLVFLAELDENENTTIRFNNISYRGNLNKSPFNEMVAVLI